MLRNKFRKFTGIIILLVFGFAIYKFGQQTQGNQYLWPALLAGFKFLAFLALVLGGVYLYDRRLKKGSQP